MNCIFCCIFNQEKYIDMFFLLLESIFKYGNLDNNTNILIYTSSSFMQIIKKNNLSNNEKIVYEINDEYNNINKACKARLDVFDLVSIKNYNKILYLDTDIIIKDDINRVFDVCEEDILYVLEEGSIDCKKDFWGKSLFGNNIKNYKDKSAFTSGILLFNNCEKIKYLFSKIKKIIFKKPYNFSCYDQPYIVYKAFKYNLYNNKILKSFSVNNDYNIYSDKVIHHFPGTPGFFVNKILFLKNFLNQLNKNIKYRIYNEKSNPEKNTRLPLIGLCISYNYFDIIKFMLPINYLHFEKIYIIIQKEDIQTIEFCKKYENIIILFYNITYDKIGALNYAQNIAYDNYPDHWYLIMDSNVILPNNFIDILCRENLNPECIYGAIRINVNNSSELLNKNNFLNRIDFSSSSVMECFQLYHSGNIFRYNNLKLICNLENIIYFYLGSNDSKFVDNINISLQNIYFTINKKINNIYYNEKYEIVKYGNYDWICSDKFYFDIYNFFKDKSYFKIVEIALNNQNNNVSTKILANIFSKVYTIQQVNIENYDNIECIDFDLFKKNQYIISENIDIAYISSRNSYEECKNYILNSIKIFKNIKYIIFDNYGVHEGVKKIVDEFIEKNIIILENFKQISNPNIGIICSLNKIFNNNLINKTYTWGNSSITFLDNYKINSFKEGNFIFTGKNKIIAYFGSNTYNIIFNDNFSKLVYNTEDNLENFTSELIFDSSYIINNIYVWGNIKIKFISNLKFYLNDDNKEYNYSIKDDLIIYSKINGIKYFIKFNKDYSEFIAKNKADNSISNGKLIFNNILIDKIYTWNNSKIKFLDNFKIHIFDIYNIEGEYIFKDKYNINLIINGIKETKYLLEFTNDYYKFKSTRINDLHIVNEKLLFDTILVNKIFTWNGKYIKFLDNFNLITTKTGIYRFINKNNIIVELDKEEYNINFNNEYTEFTYIRSYDSNIIFEKIINDSIIIEL
jgi:hypothetical protein